MAIFNNMIITNKGQKLCAKMLAEKELFFTRVVVGSGNLGTMDAENLSNIIEPKYDLRIQTILGDPNLLSQNILSGKKIFNVPGSVTLSSLGGTRIASGSTTGNNVNVGFEPRILTLSGSVHH